MSISELAIACARDWKTSDHIVRAYLAPMKVLATLDDTYAFCSGRQIVSYFLANAEAWKGEVAEGVKKELNRRLKYNPTNVKIDKIVEVKEND